jgi:hypothetical protein
MGAVYRARQPRLDRLVALKVLPAEAGRDPAFAERFTREARALARLGHPNIVSVYDFGDSDGLYYLLMEFVDGTSLRPVLRPGLPRPAEALRLGPPLCEALQYAHEEGVVHRDVKPENILLDGRGRVKVADFGLAKVLGDARPDARLTGTHQVMGTLHYMAPEQIERPLQVDHRADIYSLGVVLYEMLTGGLPLGRFPPPSERAAVDPRLDAVILRALEKEPGHRYQSAGELRSDLLAVTTGCATTLLPAERAPAPGLGAGPPWEMTAALVDPTEVAEPVEVIPVVTPTALGLAPRLLAGTTVLAAVLCFLGVFACFLRWSATPALTEEVMLNGLDTWHGRVAGGVFLIVGMLLLAGKPGRASLWRPLTLLAAGAAIAAVTFLYMSWVAEPKPLPEAPDPAAPLRDFFGGVEKAAPVMGGHGQEMIEGFLSIPGKMVREVRQPGKLLAGTYLALAPALGLLALGALQLRLRSRQRCGPP